MVDKTVYQTFKKGSKTFFTSSLFFPRSVREDIFIFYSFVRIADDLVDSIPAKLVEFEEFKDVYAQALQGKKVDSVSIELFADLLIRRQIPKEWIEAFLHSMTMDTSKKTYATFDELNEYLYGSAEVIGLVMAKLLHLPEEAYATAKTLGRAFQYINFIRDVAEDVLLGRCYFPQEILNTFNLSSLEYDQVVLRQEQFKQFMYQELDRYFSWQAEGEKGFAYIPKRFLIPIKTASDMYRYTAEQIKKNPLIVYNKKIKPRTLRILSALIVNTTLPLTRTV